jgi:hypothetical protein
MRVNFGPVAADVLFVLAGFGVLNAIGILRSSLWDAFAAIGLAFLVGVSFVATSAIALLTIGVPFRLPTFIALSLVTTVLGLLARREWVGMLRPWRPAIRKLRPAIRRPSARSSIVTVTLVAFVLYAVVVSYFARVRGLVEWDSWSIWTRKGEMLFYTGSLPKDFFASSAYAFMHADYPLLIPVFESVHFRAMGTVDTQAIHWQFWLLLVGFVWALLYLGLRRGTFFEWLPIVVAVSIVPAVYSQLLTAYADVPMALFLALGVMLLGEWLASHDGKMLALAVLMLVGSANTKNEGLMVAAIALVVAGVVTVLGPRRSDLRPLGLGALGLAAGVLPWRIWVAAAGIHGDVPVLKGLNPSFLADQIDRLWPSVKAMYMQMIDTTNWLYIIPLGTALILVSLFVAGRRSLAVFYLATGVFAFAAIVWVYWITPTVPLDFYLATSAYRVVGVLAAIALAALLQLAGPASDDQSVAEPPLGDV